MTKEARNMIIYLASVVVAFSIGAFAGLNKHEEPVTKEKIVKEIVEQNASLTSWEVLQMAIIKTESEFNSLAVGKSKDLGIFQITPIYVEEVNRILGEDRFKATDAFNIEKSLEMFGIIQDHHNPTHDADRAIRKHNPGGDSINYAKKVYENVAWIQRMEEVRKSVITKYTVSE